MSEPRDQRERETGRTPTTLDELSAYVEGMREEFSEIRSDWTDPRLQCRAGAELAVKAKALIVKVAQEREGLLEALRAVKAERLYGHLAGWPQEQTEKAWALVEAALSRAKAEAEGGER